MFFGMLKNIATVFRFIYLSTNYRQTFSSHILQVQSYYWIYLKFPVL